MSKTKMLNKINITERKKTEVELFNIFNLSPDMIWTGKLDGTLTKINPASKQILGYEINEMIGKSFLEYLHPEDLERTKNELAKALMGVCDHYIENRYRCKNGDYKWIAWTALSIKSEENFYAIGRNITERKKAEKKIEKLNKSLEQRVAKRTEELQRSKEMLTNTQHIAHLGTWEWNIADNTVAWSDEQFHIFGYKPGDIEPSFDYLLKALHPHDYEKVVTAVKEALECSAQYKIEFRIIRPDGTERNIAANGKVYLDTFGNPVKMLGTALDITERKLGEKQNKIILRTALDGFWVVDIKGRLLEVNDAYCNLIGYSHEELLKMSISDVEALERPEDTKKRIQHIIRTGSDRFESKHRCKNGRIIDIEVSTNYMDTKGGRFFVFIRDITERKKAEKILQEQKEDLEKKNIALHEVLGQIEIEKKQIKDNVIANAETLLLPIIEKISLLKGGSSKYAQLLQKNLQELTSSFGAGLSEKKLKLTSRETDVCNMVKNGLTSKEIASLLNISLQTIEKHRSHIRKKLGIANRKLNLSSVLKTI